MVIPTPLGGSQHLKNIRSIPYPRKARPSLVYTVYTVNCRHHTVLSSAIFIELVSYPRDTLNNRRAASPLVRLVEGEEKCEDPNHSHGVLHQN
ncbi:hypothetical protein TNCV_2824011 [Trichonephila clavipes]|nr:hypothetical protein TNCV_2824011 [Trichonephila clavipes]